MLINLNIMKLKQTKEVDRISKAVHSQCIHGFLMNISLISRPPRVLNAAMYFSCQPLACWQENSYFFQEKGDIASKVLAGYNDFFLKAESNKIQCSFVLAMK